MAENLSLRDIEGAERLMGVEYTADERQMMLDNLEGQIASATARRSVGLGNDEPMATRFDPRLPGFAMPAGEGPPSFSDRGSVPLPAADEDIAFAPVTELSAWLRSGALTSRRLTESYLARIEALNPDLECFATVTADLALAEADAADSLLGAGVWLGPLHGVPYGLKDLFDTRGIVTGWGAEPFRDRVPERDAVIVQRLRAAGAVLLGKTTVGALAYNDIWYGGVTRNPWNLNEGSSGSSAGSASATAAGLCAFSIGTETLGSITSPSQRCGTTGLRPTFGRVPRTGGMALCWTLDKVGPICRSVEDTAMVLAVLNGADIGDPSSIAAPFRFDHAAPWKGLRVGYLPAAFEDGATEVDHAAPQAVRDLGLDVVEAALPDLPYGALMNILYAEAAAAFEDLTLTGADDTLTWQDDGAWPNTFRKARFLSAVDHVQLDRLRLRVMKALDGLFREIDVLIGPFMTGPMLIASNFTGHPCLHLRAG
ncbi:MAG: amidase, partial [Roseicyclus sp.]